MRKHFPAVIYIFLFYLAVILLVASSIYTFVIWSTFPSTLEKHNPPVVIVGKVLSVDVAKRELTMRRVDNIEQNVYVPEGIVIKDSGFTENLVGAKISFSAQHNYMGVETEAEQYHNRTVTKIIVRLAGLAGILGYVVYRYRKSI